MSALRRAVLVGFGLVAGLNLAHAASTLTYQSTDLADVVVGEDLWQNVYTFAGALVEFGGLTVFFDYTRHAQLDVLNPIPSDLSLTLTQPSVLLETDGLVTLATDLVQDQSYIAKFTVTYVKVNALPSSQPYEVFDPNYFEPVEKGIANQIPVPEPASALMLGLGSLALLALRRRPTSI